ncbi:MAG: hypothetical protein ACYDA6_06530 [Solirubrobacteraceae bacterium]
MRSVPSAMIALGVLVGSFGVLAPVQAAHAQSYVADLCATPSGTAVGASGVTDEQLGVGQVFYVMREQACTLPGEELTMSVGPNSGQYASQQGGMYTYSTPPGVTISSYRMALSSYAGSCTELTGVLCYGGVGQVFINHTDQPDPAYDFRNLGYGATAPRTLNVEGLERVNQVHIGVACDGESGPCDGMREIARVAIPWAQFTLDDASVPAVQVVSSPSVGGGGVGGKAEWAFRASDGGPGLYAVVEEVDGQVVGDQPLDESGTCRNLGTAAIRTFSSPQPCAPVADSSAALSTNTLSDGEHHVHLYVEDASGVRATVFAGTLLTANGPIVESPPTIGGVAQVGSTLTAANGMFKPREGNTMTAESGQWMRCIAPSSCEVISGATGTSYSPTPADVG